VVVPAVAGGRRHRPREVAELVDIVPRNGRRVYDMGRVVDAVVDAGSRFEVQPGYGPAVLCALCRLGGHPVAVVANQPMVLAGSIDADGADKAARFIEVADSFHLPLVFLSDNPGVMPGRPPAAGDPAQGGHMFAAQTLATSRSSRSRCARRTASARWSAGMIPFDGQSGVFACPARPWAP
jgi:acetyl-CoA carboxylase carboxyltransferase component